MAHAAVATPASIAVKPSIAESEALAATIDASIAAYLGSAERMRTLLGWLGIASVAVAVLVAVAWAAGILPGAIKLF